MRQILHTDAVGRRMTIRDALLLVQISICAVLVTSSLVAVRGMPRSLHSNYGFEPRRVTVVAANLHGAGYSADTTTPMQKRMITALETIPGVTSVGLVDAPPLTSAGNDDSNIFTNETTDLRASNAAADATTFKISPEYFRAAGTSLLTGRTFTWHDDKDAPRVAVVNLEFARRLFGSAANVADRCFKTPDGTSDSGAGHCRRWGICEPH